MAAAAGAGEIVAQPLPAEADPRDAASGVPRHERVRGHVGDDDATRPDQRALTDRYPANDSRVRTDGGAMAHSGGKELLRPRPQRRAQVPDVREHHVRSEKHFVLDRDAVPDEDRVLDCDAVAHGRPVFDEGMVADVALGTDDRALHDVGEGPDTGAWPDVVALAEPLLVHEDGRIAHGQLRAARSAPTTRSC